MDHVIQKLKEIFETTLDFDVVYEGAVDNIDYYNLFCKAAAKERLFRLLGHNVCMANYKFNDKDSILVIFAIPINFEETTSKSVAEKVMEIVTLIEKCFIFVDYIKTVEVKEDKFIYLTIVKHLEVE